MTLACGLCFSHKTRASRRGTFSGMSRRARARIASPARAKTFRARRRGAIRTTFEHFFFFFRHMYLYSTYRGAFPYVPGSLRLTEHVSHDEPRSNEKTRKNPKKTLNDKNTSGAQRRDVSVCGSADEGCRVHERGEPGGGWRVAPRRRRRRVFPALPRDAPVSSRGAHRGCGAAGVPDRRRRAPRAVPHPGAALEAQALLGGARAGKRAEAERHEGEQRRTARRRRRRPTRDRGFGSRRRRRPRPRPRRVRARGAALRARARARGARGGGARAGAADQGAGRRARAGGDVPRRRRFRRRLDVFGFAAFGDVASLLARSASPARVQRRARRFAVRGRAARG